MKQRNKGKKGKARNIRRRKEPRNRHPKGHAPFPLSCSFCLPYPLAFLPLLSCSGSESESESPEDDELLLLSESLDESLIMDPVCKEGRENVRMCEGGAYALCVSGKEWGRERRGMEWEGRWKREGRKKQIKMIK